MKELRWEENKDGAYTADAYPLDGSLWFYSEYRVTKVGGRWVWQLVSVTWDDEDEINEYVVAEGAPTELFLDATGAANEHFREGQINTNPLDEVTE